MVIFVKKKSRKAVTFVSAFLHLMTNQHLHAILKISRYLAYDNVWLAAKNSKDQNLQ